MPPALVRPYVRVIPIAYIPPAPPRRSTIPPRPAQPVYHPRHVSPVNLNPPQQPPRRRHARRRRAPALAWGALLITITGGAIALKGGDDLMTQAQAAESSRLETALVPAPLDVVTLAPAPRRPDAPTRAHH
nr:hypothetical protein GCM10020063_059340 [Dactylosporangium thailandense]